MTDADDYIENEIKQDTLVFMYPLELRLEMQEEIDFQNRLEKEQRVIAKIKQIAQARWEYNQDWLESADNGMRTTEDYINTFVGSDVFLKQTKAKQEALRVKIQLSDWTSGFRLDRNFFKSLVDKINRDTPYLIEVLYIAIYEFDIQKRSFEINFSDKNQNSTLRYLSSILTMLDPFLTKEFHCFFLQIKNSYPIDKKKKLNALIYLNINMTMIKEYIVLGDAITNKIKKHRALITDQLVIVLIDWIAAAGIIMQTVVKSQKIMEHELKVDFVRLTSKNVDLTMLSFWEQTRSNFGLIYNLVREAEEINHFVDDFMSKEKIKIKNPAVSGLSESFMGVVEAVPALDDVFLEKTLFVEVVQQDEITDSFFQLKKQQLFLWQERVKQRRDQKEHQEKMQRERVDHLDSNEDDIDSIDMQKAQQLDALYKTTDEADKLLYHSLFKSDASCKPHNVRFRDIEKLIKNFGGTLELDTGSSHFAIHLPDTHHLWTADTINSTLSYIDVAQATGGSYKPHNHSEEWTRSAHNLLQKAFIKAGITPQRLARAEQMMLTLFNPQFNPRCVS